jgi:hypothetical protein
MEGMQRGKKLHCFFWQRLRCSIKFVPFKLNCWKTRPQYLSFNKYLHDLLLRFW